MANYDLNKSLSPIDFELLSKDLLEADLGIKLENFSEGRDKGVDLRYATSRKSTNGSKDWIVQCKRYATYASLKSHLKNHEIPKIKKLKPGRYFLATSVSLSVNQVDELKKLLHPFVKKTGDIYGGDRLNGILTNNPEIERRQIKLWATSAGVLDSIINAGTHIVSRDELEWTIAVAKIFVRNPSFDEALEILKKYHVCIISGIPGIGKTTLARMLLLYFYDIKFDIAKIESDISEAHSGVYHKNPRFYYYDDFLGQSTFADKLNKNEDQKLLDFMKSISAGKSSVFVLTTREYILNQAKISYEKIDRQNFDYLTCVVDLSKYSRRIRAEILYNHLYFAGLPKLYLNNLLANQGYLKIIDHRNYSPRLIEKLTSKEWISGSTADGYLTFFLATLSNPMDIWDHPYKSQISDASRHLLLVLTTLPISLAYRSLETCFDKFHLAQCSQFGMQRNPMDFKKASKELDDTFIKIRKVADEFLVTFQNPSIRDFMQNLLFGGELIDKLIESLIFFEQAEWFIQSLSARPFNFPPKDFLKYKRSLIAAMIRLIDAESCSISVIEVGDYSSVDAKPSNVAARLSQIAEWIDEAEYIEEKEFIRAQIKLFTSNLNCGQMKAAECAPIFEMSRSIDLDVKTRDEFIEALKISAAEEPSELERFETIGELVTTFSESFSMSELYRIRDDYSKFLKEYSRKCEDDNLGIDDPDDIRAKASRIEHVGVALQVETDDAQDIVRNHADAKQQENSNNINWTPDDSPSLSGNIREECTNKEIESMFLTLEN